MFSEFYQNAFLKIFSELEENKQHKIKKSLTSIYDSIKNISYYYFSSKDFREILSNYKKSEESEILINLILLIIENGHSNRVLKVLQNIKHYIIKEELTIYADNSSQIKESKCERIIIDNKIIDGCIIYNDFKKQDSSVLTFLEKMNDDVKQVKLINFLF